MKYLILKKIGLDKTITLIKIVKFLFIYNFLINLKN